MNDSFLGNCCNSDNCLSIIKCSWYTPKQYNHETIPSPQWCDNHDKLVFIEPYTSSDWDILQKQYMRCDGVNLDDETVLVQEGV